MIRQLIGLSAITAVIGVAAWQWLYRGETVAPLHSDGPFNQVAKAQAAESPAAAAVSSPPVNSGWPPSLVQTHSAPTPSGASALVQRIVQPYISTRFSERLEAVEGLSRALAPAEIEALYAYLLSQTAAGEVSDRSEALLRNNIMNKLAEQDTIPADLAHILVGIYEDRRQHAVMRDYAVQHLSASFSRLSKEDQTLATSAFQRATAEIDSSIAGTAMLALARVLSDPAPAGGNYGKLQNDFRQTVLTVAGNQKSGELARITAISLSGRFGLREALPIATSLVRTAESIPLQIAAIAALGDFGGATAEAVLWPLSENSEPRLRVAAQSALSRVTKHHENR
jgi:hypothetical protein